MSALATPLFKKTLLSTSLLFILANGFAFSQTESLLSEASPQNNKPIIDLSQIVVTAGGFAQEVKDAPASISVVSQQELAQAPFRDVTDAIADVPGVVITGGGSKQDISIRGMAPKYTLMMVDGKRQNSRETRPNSDNSGIEQGWIPPLAAIERVEVIRGPISSRYGSDAMGGVVNIITKKVSDRWLGSVRTEFTLPQHSETGASNNSEFYLSGPIVHEKLGLQLFGKYSDRREDKYINGVPERRMDNIGGKLTFVPVEGHSFEIDYGVGFQKRLSHTGKTIAEFSKNKAGNLVPNKNSESKYKRNNFSARYLGEFDHGITTDLLYSYEKNNNYTRDMITKSSELSGNIVLPVGDHTITVGGQYRKDKLSDAGNQLDVSINKISRWSYGIFVEDEWWMTDNFAITAGLRYDRDQKYGGEITPRLYAVWNVDDAWTVKGGISKGYAAPGLRQSVDNWGQITGGGAYKNIDAIILGNSALKPEKSMNYELGFSFMPHDDFNLNATTFYTKFKDKIETDRTCQLDGYGGSDSSCQINGENFWYIEHRENLDSAKLYGLELAAAWKPQEDLKLSANYTYSKTEITSGDKKGTALNRIPQHLINLKADWQVTPQANLWAKTTFHGKEAGVIGRGNIAGKEYRSYTMVDFGGAYKFSRDVNLYAGIHNVTDRKLTEDSHGKTIDGRRYWVGVSVDF